MFVKLRLITNHHLHAVSLRLWTTFKETQVITVHTNAHSHIIMIRIFISNSKQWELTTCLCLIGVWFVCAYVNSGWYLPFHTFGYHLIFSYIWNSWHRLQLRWTKFELQISFRLNNDFSSVKKTSIFRTVLGEYDF